ncbi:MAG: T9SS type A sorting domain-containing protein [Saprospiraceae bacterium]|nr:T9SS type A sorting domain-containing protein [Saprospiraceae bacterium]
MHHYYRYLLFYSFLAFISCQSTSNDKPESSFPKPTYEKYAHQDKTKARQTWMDQLHGGDSPSNWKLLELENSLAYQDQSKSQRSNSTRSGEIETIGNGLLQGIWKERGSNNLAGNVEASAYNSETDEIYVLGHEGSLFKSPRKEDNWQVVNQNIIFNGDLLEIFDFNGQKIMLATAADIPIYSLDLGETWTKSNGIEVMNSTGRTSNLIKMSGENPTLYILSNETIVQDLSMYRSDDGGKNWSKITTLGVYNSGRVWMTHPEGTEDLYLFENKIKQETEISKFDFETNTFELFEVSTELLYYRENPIGSPTNAYSYVKDGSLIFTAYAADDIVKTSYDTCQTWVTKGKIPSHPWYRRFYVLPSNPETMIAGNVELVYSQDGGITWKKHGSWMSYYSDPLTRLHADMMYFKEFYSETDDEHFVLVSNHGGISITYDESSSYRNIGMNGLNASQYYSVRTDPNDPNYIYAGSQDQGYQRGYDSGEDQLIDFNQLISGDYAQLVFSEYGSHLWMVYPGGSVSYYDAPQTDNNGSNYYTIDSEDESVWLPPLAEVSDPSKNEVYLAGGNIDGGDGSYLIKLAIDNGSIQTSQFTTNFSQKLGRSITAISCSTIDPNLIYVGAGYRGFSASRDGGMSFSKNDFFAPFPTSFSGNSIYASKIDPGTVYYAGSGYYGPAIFVSNDYGQTFTDASAGLPQTVIVDLDANEDESLLFAATESGPYVYDVKEKSWYSMAGLNAPTTRFYSVEFLPASNKVRFGTFGRGIWDFDVMESVSTNDFAQDMNQWTVFPNPANDVITIQLENDFPEVKQIAILKLNGELISKISTTSKKYEMDISQLAPGQYVLQVQTANTPYSKLIVKQ